MKRSNWIFVCLLAGVPMLGCGGSEPTLIEHTEHYQLTPEEQANKDAETAARKNAGK